MTLRAPLLTLLLCGLALGLLDCQLRIELPAHKCDTDFDCLAGQRCSGGRCQEPPEPPPEPSPEPGPGDAQPAKEPPLESIEPGPEPSPKPELPPEPDGADVPKIFRPPYQLYAHTATKLYHLDPKSYVLEEVGVFKHEPGKASSITDIALSEKGRLYAISNQYLYRCETKATPCTEPCQKFVACTWLGTHGTHSLTGLTFVPPATVFPDREALIGCGFRSWVLLEDRGQGKIEVKKLGDLNGNSCSGDALSVRGVGTFVLLGGSGDRLAQVDPKTGAILKSFPGTGGYGLWGFAPWHGRYFVFDSKGGIYDMNLKTGKMHSSLFFKLPAGPKPLWWGAASSTLSGAP